LLLAPNYGEESGFYAGGQQSGFYRSSVDSVQLGDFLVERVPVVVKDLQPMATRLFPPGQRLNGILGTVMLYHLLATVDFPHKELVLRPNTDAGVLDFEAKAASEHQATGRFWLVGDHSI